MTLDPAIALLLAAFAGAYAWSVVKLARMSHGSDPWSVRRHEVRIEESASVTASLGRSRAG